MKLVGFGFVVLAAAAAAACSAEAPSSSPSTTGPSAGGPEAPATTSVRHRSDITPVTRVEDALPGVFIPAFLDCRDPLPGEKSSSADGKVCTHVSIAGATEPGKSFASYASCDLVRTQRPYYAQSSNTKATDPKDARLKDAAYMAEVAWAKQEVAATGCACCHDAKIAPDGASKWDIAGPGIWLDTVSNKGLALFAGLADSSVLGAYPADQNHGFDRTSVGLPSTDPARLKKLVVGELARRGVSEAEARKVAPFGGPIYEASIAVPERCGAGEGVDPDGNVMWQGGSARYVYVLEAGSKNPGVPPNLDRPAGTVWRLDVLPSAAAVESGLRYGTTPGTGSYQDTPAEGLAPSLTKGRTYFLHVLHDMGLPITSCTFVYGEPVAAAPPPTSTTPPPVTTSTDGGAPTTPVNAFGRTCKESKECEGVASYCAVMPGKTTGYCTATGCKTNASVCPTGWSCFDVSLFQPGAPSICTKP